MREDPSDSEDIRRLKETFYALTYMDNIGYTSSDSKDVELAYENSFKIFNTFKFDLQKFYTNLSDFQARIDSVLKEGSPQIVDLLGLKWDRIRDNFVCSGISLDNEANTKRKILGSVNSVFDLCGFLLPLMNRAKSFLHKLQIQQDLGWDDVLEPDQLREWQCICKQLAQLGEFRIPRSFGDRSSEYRLVACADASKEALGSCFYLWDLEKDSCVFLASKNKVIGKDLQTKSIPVLELVALSWAAELCIKFFKFFSTAIIPIKISDILLFCDSSISLCWVKSKITRVGKIERKSVLVNNKLSKILEAAKTHSLRLRHLAGKQNPADAATRPISPTLLKKSNYHSGPSLEDLRDNSEEIYVHSSDTDNLSVLCAQTEVISVSPVMDFNKYSSFHKIIRVLNFVLKFIKICRSKMYEKNPIKYSNLNRDVDTYVIAQNYVIKVSQRLSFPGVLDFFLGRVSKCESIVTQLNLFLDNNGIIRVKSKFRKLESESPTKMPVLLSKEGHITKLIILALHRKMRCAQTYKLLASLHIEFYVPKAYSVVKSVIKNCIICRKLHGRSPAVNVNDYPDFHINPGRLPFSTVMIDAIGPYTVRVGNENQKQYVLLLTCMFTRAVNLIVCESLNTADFLRALQLHIFDFGVMESVVSDNQPSFVSGLECLSKVLGETEAQDFFKTCGIKSFSFNPYTSGASFLGGAVESLVKQVKNVLYVSISKNKLTSSQFSFLVAKAKALVNKRITGFKRSLTNEVEGLQVPFALTPEILIKGYEVPSFNILSLGDENTSSDQTWVPDDCSEDDLFHYFQDLNSLCRKLQALYE